MTSDKRRNWLWTAGGAAALAVAAYAWIDGGRQDVDMIVTPIPVPGAAR